MTKARAPVRTLRRLRAWASEGGKQRMRGVTREQQRAFGLKAGEVHRRKAAARREAAAKALDIVTVPEATVEPAMAGKTRRVHAVAAERPAPTPEYDALTPQGEETGLDALARVGDTVMQEFGGVPPSKDPNRDPKKHDKKLPKQLAALVALRAQHYDNAEIAEKLGISAQALKSRIVRARKLYGWSDLGDKLLHVAVPLAVESTIKHLEYEGSKDGVEKGLSAMTRATLSGVGLFKTYSAVKQESETKQTTILRVEIALPEMPLGLSRVVTGSVLATPRRALPPRSLSIPAVSVEEVKP